MMVRRAEKRFEKKPVSERRTRARRARHGRRSRAPGRARIRTRTHPIARGGLTHLHARRSGVRGARRGVVLWTRDAFGDTIERARRQVTAATRARRGSPSRAVRVPARRTPATRLTGRRVDPNAATGGPRDDTAASRAVPGAHHESNKKKSAALFTPGGGGFLFVIFVTACALGGTRFSAAARFGPRKPTTPPLRRGTSRRARLASGPSRHVARRSACFVDTQHPRARTSRARPLLRVKSGRVARSAPERDGDRRWAHARRVRVGGDRRLERPP